MVSSLVILYGRENKVLLQLRDAIKTIDYPSYWSLFGGRVELGETPIQGVIRELKEELEYDLTENNLNLFTTTKILGKDIFIFIAPYNSDKIVFNEGSDAKFFSREEIENIKIIPEIKTVLEKYWKEFK